MKASTCCCAPAPMDIIDTTAATPKIIPSIVRSERTLLASSVSIPRLQSTRICKRAESSNSAARRDIIGRLRAPDPSAALDLLPAVPVSGLTSATSWLASKSCKTMRFSVTRTTFTDTALNCAPSRTYTTGLPSFSKSTCRGRCVTPLSVPPSTSTRAVMPGLSAADGRSRANAASN